VHCFAAVDDDLALVGKRRGARDAARASAARADRRASRARRDRRALHDRLATTRSAPGDTAFAAVLGIPLHHWPGGHDGAYWHAHYARYLRFYADAPAAC